MTATATLRRSNAPLGTMARREDVSGMPSMARFRVPGGTGCFVVVDPAAGRKILGDGTATAGGLRRTQGLLILALSTLVGVAIWLGLADGAIVGRVAIGASIGAVVGAIVRLVVNALLDLRGRLTQTRAGVPLSWKTYPIDGRAWRLCEIAVRISTCAAWRDGTIDTARQVPALLWSAVGRSLVVESDRLDAERALQHGSLRELARESLARVKRESESLDVVEENLQRVLITAWSVQERRARAVRQLARDRVRLQEERELRARLTAFAITTDAATESDDHADRSVGLAAEVAAIDTLLDSTDQVLRAPNPRRR